MHEVSNAVSEGEDRALVFAAHFQPGYRAGGPIRSLVGILDSAPPSITATLITRDRDLGTNEAYPGLSGRMVAGGRHHVLYVSPGNPRHWVLILRELTSPSRFIYLNSLWNPIFAVLPSLLWRMRIIRSEWLLVAPRGQLFPGALSRGPRRKRCVLAYWRWLSRTNRVVWHASTDVEAHQCHRLLSRGRVLVSLDPVSLPSVAAEPHASSGDPLHAVFVSRISPKKNLIGAISALSGVDSRVHFKIVGPIDDPNYWSDCLAEVKKLPKNVTIEYLGSLEPAAVRLALVQADVFLFPTHGENFGHVVAESLAAACPVICGRDTPWSKLIEQGGGILVNETDETAITAAVCEFASLDQQARLDVSRKVGSLYEDWWKDRDRSNVLQDMLILADELR